MEAFTRHVRLGTEKTWAGGYVPVWVTIKFTGGKEGRLSITGCIGRSSFGQIQGHLLHMNWGTFAKGWNKLKVASLHRTWERWHLNDMQAGTVNQMEIVRQVTGHIDHYPNYYDTICNILEQCDLLEDEGYRYGSKWLLEEVPEHELWELKNLPEADRPIPYWVY